MSEPSVAVLLDCENVSPAAIDKAMRIASSLGRVTIRRAYGNSAALHKGHEALLQHGFAPCMQFQYVSGKNTADIALALDALELLLEGRAGCYLIVTSDSDFVGLCHKLKERGATVHIVGEEKSPAALRNACDAFHVFVPVVTPLPQVESTGGAPTKLQIVAGIKRRPKFIVEAVREMGKASPDGSVDLGSLGNFLRKDRPDFSCADYGYKNLRSMLESYDLLHIPHKGPGTCRVSLVPAPIQLAG